MLAFNIFLFSDEDHRYFFNAIGVGCSIIFLEVGSILQIVEDGEYGG